MKLLTALLCLLAGVTCQAQTNYIKLSLLPTASATLTNDYYAGIHWTGSNYATAKFRVSDVWSFVNDSVSGLASQTWVSNSLAPYATTNLVNTASNGAVATAVALATNQSSTVSSNQIAAAIAPLATQAQLAALASTNYVLAVVTNSAPICGRISVPWTQVPTYTISFASPVQSVDSYALFLTLEQHYYGGGNARVFEVSRTLTNVVLSVNTGTNTVNPSLSWALIQTNAAPSTITY